MCTLSVINIKPLTREVNNIDHFVGSPWVLVSFTLASATPLPYGTRLSLTVVGSVRETVNTTTP